MRPCVLLSTLAWVRTSRPKVMIAVLHRLISPCYLLLVFASTVWTHCPYWDCSNLGAALKPTSDSIHSQNPKTRCYRWINWDVSKACSKDACYGLRLVMSTFWPGRQAFADFTINNLVNEDLYCFRKITNCALKNIRSYRLCCTQKTSHWEGIDESSAVGLCTRASTRTRWDMQICACWAWVDLNSQSFHDFG